MSLGEGQALFIVRLNLGLEHVELFDNAGERVGRHLGAGEQPLLDAEAIEDGALGYAMGLGQEGVDGLLNDFRGDLASLALVGAGLVLHNRNAVLLVTGVPGLDGAPGEVAGVAILVSEGHLADSLDAGTDGVALGHVDGAQDAHFEIRSRILHHELTSIFVGRRRLPPWGGGPRGVFL